MYYEIRLVCQAYGSTLPATRTAMQSEYTYLMFHWLYCYVPFHQYRRPKKWNLDEVVRLGSKEARAMIWIIEKWFGLIHELE